MKTDIKLPPKINWRITSKCDISPSCPYCYSPKLNDICNNDRDKICDILINNKVKIVGITGGEPMCCDNIVDVINKLHRNNIYVVLYTNGNSLMRIIPDFYKTIDMLALPIDLSCNLRSNKSFDSVIELLKFVQTNELKKKYGIKLKVQTLLNDSNLDKINEIAQIIDKYDVDKWKIFSFIKYHNRNENFLSNIDISNLPIEPLLINDCKVVTEDSKDRSGRYLIINSDGGVVTPLNNEENITTDVFLGSIFDDINQIAKKWKTTSDSEKYSRHYNESYMHIYG